MEDPQEICCYCGEPTYFSEGYMIWKSNQDENKWGHQWCIEKYDKEYLNKELNK
jgi:hypothetical protein